MYCILIAALLLDPPLHARRNPTCPKDPIAQEMVAHLRHDVRFELVVSVRRDGRVELPPAASKDRLLEFARRCVAAALFEAPPRRPYRMRVTVHFLGRDHTGM